ncbi:MAG TPA: hypothetical protein GXZ22_05150 [Clostridiaceae bacterium]|nr:hypothetical protein [Clostridiaceae bacterium]
MNTQGWLRGLMAKNMGDGKFVRHVAECLSREFDLPVDVFEGKDDYTIRLDRYEVTISKYAVNELRNRGAYALDKMLMDKLKEKGFEFDNERSQYIRYCYGIFYKDPEGNWY